MKRKKGVHERQEALKSIIVKYPIEDQAQLVKLLYEKYAIVSNQSIISRDLHDLGIAKRKYKDTFVYELSENHTQKEILRLGVQDILYNQTTVVVKTMGGWAAFVGDYLDSMNNKHILATLAGENVVFILPKSTNQTAKVYELVCTLLHFRSKEAINE